jgi:hypothetical protein
MGAPMSSSVIRDGATKMRSLSIFLVDQARRDLEAKPRSFQATLISSHAHFKPRSFQATLISSHAHFK